MKNPNEEQCTCKKHDPYCCHIHGSCPTCVKKEEPKQETIGKQFYETADMVISVIRNKQTLEEAAKRLYPINGEYFDKEFYMVRRIAFIEGAKWMQERMYSEEEVIKIVEKSRVAGLTAEYLLLTEQFKKK